MEEIELNSWEEFESKIQRLFSLTELRREKAFSVVSQPLFRGHDDYDYPLESTLDRIQPNYTLSKYYSTLEKILITINSCTEHNWTIPKYIEPKTPYWFVPPAYNFMSYLRHHGFPSPLLDWSRSPYIAAFFAFNSHSYSSKVAIFSFIESMGYGKIGPPTRDDPAITGLGQYVTTHKRHYLQQSNYTICTKRINNEISFTKHQDVTTQAGLDSIMPEQDLEDIPEQDLLFKFILPASEKRTVLTKLDLMNINEYSLFGTEEALMGTLRNREFPL
ncbi:MAG: FRG domain-containing protein [Planctomycetes bacterium]|nr:FRG domain-containing protein [Planctomycetota bacterium]